MSILKSLTRLGGSASLTAIANDVGESAAKVHRYLSSFAQEGFVAQNTATLHYHLGPESIRLGLAALRQCDPVRLGEGALLRLRESLEVTCFIAVMGNLGPTVLRIEEPSLPVTVNIRAGSVLPLLWSATGQAFMAFSDDAEVHRKAELEFEAGPGEPGSLVAGPQAVFSHLRGPENDLAVTIESSHDVNLGSDVDSVDAHGSLRDRPPAGASCPATLLALVDAGTPPWGPRDTVRAQVAGRGRRSQCRGWCLIRFAATLSRRGLIRTS